MFILSMLLDYYFSYYFNMYTTLYISVVITYIYLSKKNNLKTILLLGIIYDLLFSNILFVYLICFYIIYSFINYFKRKASFTNYLIILITSTILSYISIYLLLYFLNRLELNIYDLVSVITKGIMPGIIFGIISYIYFKKIVIKRINL